MKKALLYCFLYLATRLFSGTYHPAIDYIFPLPDSEFLTPHATIILKLDLPYNDQITDLSDLISVRGEAGAYGGTTFFAADGRTIIFKPDAPFTYDEFIDVTIQTSQFADSDFSYTFHTVQERGNVPAGLAKTAAPEKSTQLNHIAYEPPRLINGVAVPSDFPRIEAHQYAETAPGMIFYATNYPQEGTGNYLIICTNDGTPYFYRRYDDVIRSGNLTVHPTGVLTAHFYHKWFYIVLDQNFVEMDTIRVGHGYETDNHELQILENGHALLVARDRIKVDMSQIVNGGQHNATVEGHHFQELDADHNVIFEWRSWDYYSIPDTYVGTSGGFLDYVHMNSIAIDYDGHYVISARDLNEITKINRNTGDIIWRLNGRNNEFEFLNDPIRFLYQHDFRPVPGKPNHYTIFDNGRGRNNQYSRVVEYKIDPEAKTIEKVWEYRHQPDWYSSAMGSAQRLPNGNTLGDFPGGSLRVAEVNPAGEVVFELYSRGHSNYRCRRFDWTGQMPQPYLISENLGPVVRLIFNKFGDDNVKQYNIYYGTSPHADQFLTATTETYFDVADIDPNILYYFRVTAVDQNGSESDFSNQATGSINYIGPGQNAVRNSTFESRDFWSLNTSDGAVAISSIHDGQYRINVTNSNGSMGSVQLAQNGILVLQNKKYTFEFDAFADAPRAINAKVESAASPFINFGKIGNTALTTRLKRYKYTFTMEQPTESAARVVFNCGGQTGHVYIDNVSLTYADETAGDVIVKINFQPEDAATPDGYQTDSGHPFGDRGNGFNYGWLGGVNNETRLRNGNTDLRYATLNHLQKTENRVWELALPNGSYHVHLVMGDAGYTDQINHVQIEDVVLLDPDGEGYFDEFITTVDVRDGRLTVQPTDESSNAKLCFIDVSAAPSTISGNGVAPAKTSLHQNYPNPFNAETRITFELARDEHVRLVVYDVRGRLVKTLLNESLTAGAHARTFSAAALASGVYFYKLEANSFIDVRKMMLVK